MANNVVNIVKNGQKGPKILVILDGFGCLDRQCGLNKEKFCVSIKNGLENKVCLKELSDNNRYNAIYNAQKPNFDKFIELYPHTTLKASGEYVGLLPGFIGNSEVGHCTIGCGQIVKQPLAIISDSIKDGSFFNNIVLQKELYGLKRLHIMGLLSDAGVHSHIEHLYAFLKAAKLVGIKEVYIHPFLDGRDVYPNTAGKYLGMLEEFLDKLIDKKSIGENFIYKIASLHGRFYAMDRDKNFDRTKKSYDVLMGVASGDLVKGNSFVDNKICDKNIYPGSGQVTSWPKFLENCYESGITDEFIEPVNLEPQGIIKDGDGVIFFNFRPDRAKQLTAVILGDNLADFKEISSYYNNFQGKSCVKFITPVEYDKNLKTSVMFKKKHVKGTLKEILQNNKKSILSIAETEKFAHVTYFFDGGNQIHRDNDTWVLVESKKMKSYASCPEMQADKITEMVLNSLKNDPKDFYLINYANADMVGHSGDFNATVKAVEYLDKQLGILYDIVVEKMGGAIYLTADHGKAEKMFDENIGKPCTAHTANDVPFIFIKKGLEGSEQVLNLNKLSDLAGFILQDVGA